MATRTKTAATEAEAPVKETKPERKPKAKEIDIHQYIPVLNGFQGQLVYVSKRTGEEFNWDHFGDEQEIELQELKNAKSSAKAFFENNWFLFGEEYQWVIDYLGLGAYYKKALNLKDFDEIFTKSPEEVKEVVGGLSKGQKASVAYRAIQLIADNGIDSNRVIAALEEALGVSLTEK